MSTAANHNPVTVVLDDDPTGTQTVHGVPIVTSWARETLLDEFTRGDLFYILTNSRALVGEESVKIHREIARNLLWASEQSTRAFNLVSRSDSTLRGHFPLETDTIRDEIRSASGKDFDAMILIPFFLEGGRTTVYDTHFVANQHGSKIPVAETEFAKDPAFGFSNSSLSLWIEEKSNGRISAKSVISFSIREIRKNNIPELSNKLKSLENFRHAIVNAENYDDLRVFVEALHAAMASGKRFLFRTAASFVPTFAGIRKKQPLSYSDIFGDISPRPGIVIAGSHVKKTTRQIQELSKSPDIATAEFNVMAVESDPEGEARRVANFADTALAQGKNCLVFTSRGLVRQSLGISHNNLAFSVAVSKALCRIPSMLREKPAFIVAKGGITASDIAVHGLGIRRAKVLGQIIPGVPLWLPGDETVFPNTPYVVFPGNVGDNTSLARVVAELSGKN